MVKFLKVLLITAVVLSAGAFTYSFNHSHLQADTLTHKNLPNQH